MRMTKANDKVTISIVGAGNRATAYISAMNKHYKSQFEITAIFDPSVERQEYYQTKYGVKPEMTFNGYEDFVKMPRISDVVIIATLDDMHYVPMMHAIEMGYDIILEKPIAMNLEETIKIGEAGCERKNQFIGVCHVLRHSAFFKKLKEIIDSKVLGNIVNIQHNENIGYYHFAHSYVRGSWRNNQISAPLIVAKACHDMDILLYLLGDKHCLKVSSLGDLTFFNKKNYKPDVMASHCSECKIEGKCPYSAIKIYGSGKIRSVVFDDSTAERLKNELSTSQYGRCVFACDNDVCDHQVTALEFEDGIHATFNLSAFTNKIHRSIKIMCEYGEIRGIETTREIEVTRFGESSKTIYIPEVLGGGHGGADEGFVIGFMDSYINKKPFSSELAMAIESHVMAYAAEHSRRDGGVPINIQEYHDKILKGGK